MRILVIFRYYWPDTAPEARLLKPILEKLVEDGHEVTVFTGQPGYNDIRQARRPWREQENGVDIIRASLLPEKKSILISRLANFLLFLFMAAAYALIGRRWDMVLVHSHPPVIMGLTARLLGRLLNIPYVYHCQDLQPESALFAGKIKKGASYDFLRGLDAGNCRGAEVVVTLSEDMANTIKARGVEGDNVLVLNNFIVDTSQGAPRIPDELKRRSENEMLVLYAGNIGNFQGLDSVVEAAELLRDNPGIRFIFMGEGAAKAGLMKKAGGMIGETVTFVPYQPVETAFAAMESADFGLVSLQKDVYKVAFPSKTMMYYAAGCPVIAIVEDESVLAREIAEGGLGYTAPPGNPERIAGIIRTAWDNRDGWRTRRGGIRKMAEDVFGRDRGVESWSELARRIESKGC